MKIRSKNWFNRFRTYGAVTLLTASIAGCDIINPEETIPSYIYIDPFTITCNLETQGFPSTKISDAWVYSNGQFIGAFEIPASIPLLTEGVTELIIYPGIKENGISGVSMIYPFYNAYTTTRTLTAGETDTLYPTSTYKPSAGITFSMLERFESSNAFEGIETDASLTTTTDPTLVFEGNRSAITTLFGEADTFRVISSNPIVFPGADKQMFLEIDYQCDVPYNVWMKCNTANQPIYDEILTVTAKESWNKIYINLNPSLQFFSQYQPESVQIEFRSIHTGTDTARILYDNIKIIQTK